MMRPAAIAALALLAACGPVVDRVELRPTEVVLDAAGATARIQATPRDAAGAALALPVRWTSHAPAVATVDASGTVTAVGTGVAVVTAGVAGLAAEVRVRVSIPVRAALEPAGLELVGLPSQGVLQLRLQDRSGGAVAVRRPLWRSSDEGVARVEDGRVTAVGPGKATVSATDAGLTATADVEVRYPEFAAIEARPARLSLAVGRSARIEAGALDGAGRPVSGVPLGFSSSDGAVASVAQDGTVTALRSGKARVQVSGGGKSAAVSVTVRKK